jgi:acyl carrier protein
MSALAHESAGERHATPGESHFVERLERAVSHARLPLTQKLIRETVAGVMQTPAERLHLERGFFEQGMDSLMAVEAAKLLTGELGRVIHASDMFQYANVSALSEHVLRDLLGLAEDRANAVAQPVVSARREPIAVRVAVYPVASRAWVIFGLCCATAPTPSPRCRPRAGTSVATGIRILPLRTR